MFSKQHLIALRAAETEVVVGHFWPGARILELGAGAGHQALDLSQRGFDVAAVDVPTSNYADARVFPVRDYDGRTLPFEAATFDIVFSSNVLEHVKDLPRLHDEIRRVLKPGGKCVHVLPTHAWRFWTTLSAFPVAVQYLAALAPETLPRRVGRSELRRLVGVALRALKHLSYPIRQARHGERGNVITELYYFRPAWWREHFRQNHFAIVHERPMGLFYTGHMVLPKLSFAARGALATRLGSACHLFELSPEANASAPTAPTPRTAVHTHE
jgi:SAM-dependent methyltransferase